MDLSELSLRAIQHTSIMANSRNASLGCEMSEEKGPFVSVVIPSYNRARASIAAVDSVLRQTYSNYEIIFVDDGSTDETPKILRQFLCDRGVSCDRVRYFYQRNQGPSFARNTGIAEAKGDWIAFLDSDDTWLPEKLESQVQAIEQFKGRCGACFSDAKLLINLGLNTTAFKAAGRDYNQDVGLDTDGAGLLARAFGGPWVQTLIARTDLVRQIGGFDLQLHFAEDHDFLFRLFLITEQCYVNIPLAIIDRTGTPGSGACRKWEKLDFRLEAHKLMFEKWLKMKPPLPPRLLKTVRHNLRAVHSAWANLCLEGGQYKAARQQVAKAVQYEFTPSLALKWALATIAPWIARRIVPRSKSYSELT
jgi:glycosyltransferase involved in cell wall biosynthesis